MTKREKRTVYTGVTREAMEEAFDKYATADAREAKINAQMDVEITKIRTKYASELATLKAEMDVNFDVMQSFATENKGNLFCKKKSLECVHGTIGFRIGTPKLKTQKGTVWATVLENLKVYLPKFVRVTEEPAKDLLLASRDDEEVTRHFSEVGIYVDQDETFYVEPKKEADNG